MYSHLTPDVSLVSLGPPVFFLSLFLYFYLRRLFFLPFSCLSFRLWFSFFRFFLFFGLRHAAHQFILAILFFVLSPFSDSSTQDCAEHSSFSLWLSIILLLTEAKCVHMLGWCGPLRGIRIFKALVDFFVFPSVFPSSTFTWFRVPFYFCLVSNTIPVSDT